MKQFEFFTLSNLFDLYLVYTKKINSSQTTKTNISNFKNHLEPYFKDKKCIDITLLDLQKHFNYLLDSDLSIKTVKNIKALLSAMYSRAIQNQILSYNIVKHIELPKFDNQKYFNHSLTVQQDFISSIENYTEEPYCDIFYFLFQGRRLSEVLKLTWSDVDLNESIYTIPSNINKAKKSMSYKMTDELRSRLYSVYYKSQLLNLDVDNGYIFINPDTNTRYKTVTKAFKRFLKSNNLPTIRIHDIRHLIATYSINYLRLPIEHVSHTLGHSDISITQKYITKIPDTSKNVSDSIFNSIKSDELV
jgi:integrase